MKKSFVMKNDIGIDVNYRILAQIDDEVKHIIYTDHMPADNVLGIRLLAGEVKNENPLIVEHLRIRDEKRIIEDFLTHIEQTPSKKKMS